MICRYPAYFPGSTNPLDLYAIWPGEWSTKGMAALAQRTVLAMGALGSWQQANALPEMVPAAVRAGVEPAWILGNLSVEPNALNPLLLGHSSPVLRRLFAVLSRFPASWRQDGEDGRRMA